MIGAGPVDSFGGVCMNKGDGTGEPTFTIGSRQSDGRYKLGPVTLYDNLQKLLDQGIVEERSTRSLGDDPRRRYYRLSRFGRGLLATEIARLEGLVREARLHLKIRPERRE